jgi:hypothetical protein
MPIFRYFLVMGPVLLGLLILIDANLPPAGALPNSTSFYGFQRSPHAMREVAPLTVVAAPAPDMSSAAVLAAEPKPAAAPAAETPTKTAKAAPATKKRKRVARTRNWHDDYAQANPWAWRTNKQSWF